MFADAHCDTLTRIYDKNEELYKNSGQLDLKRLLENNCCLQMMAVWIEPKYENNGFLRFNNVISNFYKEYEKNKDKIKLVTNADDLKSNKLKLLLTIEGGSAINGSILFGIGVGGIAIIGQCSLIRKNSHTIPPDRIAGSIPSIQSMQIQQEMTQNRS